MPQILLSNGPDQGVRLLTLNRPEGLEAFRNKRRPEFSGR